MDLIYLFINVDVDVDVLQFHLKYFIAFIIILTFISSIINILHVELIMMDHLILFLIILVFIILLFINKYFMIFCLELFSNLIIFMIRKVMICHFMMLF